MPTSTENPPKKTTKRGTKLVQMEPQTPFDTPKSPPETDDSPPVEARPPVSKGSTNPKPFPIPPKATLKGGYCEEAVGMAYWRGIPEEFKDRLTVYINREHPVLNRMVEVTPEDVELMRQHKKRYPIKYIDLPPEPFSEDTAGEFLNRYGSGKYKVFVNDVGIKGAKAPDLQSRNLCKFMVKVYDSDTPPVLDPSRPDKGLGVLDWTHPDNQSYVAELRTRGIFPPDEKAGDSVAESVVTTLVDKISDLSDRVGVHETDRLVERIAEKMNGGQSRASETLQIMQATKEMLTPSTAAATATTATPPPDPFEIAAKMNAARANDPMIPVLMQLLKDSQTANEAARQREYELLKERATAAPAKSFIDQALELASNPDKLEPIKKLASFFGFGGAGEGAPVRAGRTTGMDIIDHLVSGPAGAALAQGLGQLLMAAPAMFQGNPANGQQPQPSPPPMPQVVQGPPPPENPEQRINRIGTQVTRQMIGEFFLKGATGEDFAVSMYNFWPEDTVFLQSLGAENLVDRYRRFPQAWAVLSYREAEFITFMQQFCAWLPPKDEDGPEEAASDGVEDLEDKEEAQP
jgi:hypothetical protein